MNEVINLLKRHCRIYIDSKLCSFCFRQAQVVNTEGIQMCRKCKKVFTSSGGNFVYEAAKGTTKRWTQWHLEQISR